MKTLLKLFTIFIFISGLLFSIGCDKENDVKPDDNDDDTPKFTREDTLKSFVYQVMVEWYLWNDKIPAAINPDDYKTAQALLDAMMFKPTDRWSYLTDEVSFKKYFEEGAYVGFGIGVKFDAQNNLYISQVFKDSPLADKIARGWKIVKIQGESVATITNFDDAFGEDKVGVQRTFVFQNPSGAEVELTASKKEILLNTVIYKNVYTLNNRKIGYMVFDSFIETSFAELDSAFKYFQQQGVEELILDLRYNGGGLGAVANHLGSLIVGNKQNGKIFQKVVHNTSKRSYNTQDTIFKKQFSVDIKKLVVITTKGTASASEALINCLKPYIPIVLIGDDTHGKPTGMYAFAYSGAVLLPVSLKGTNTLGEGDYYEGLQADALRPDDLKHNFGDVSESCLQEALYYLENGNFSIVTKSFVRPREIPMHGLRAEIHAY